ncbi:MAG: tetratricopeptide repeat protein, partial [Candidatus Competibacterales bacterium]
MSPVALVCTVVGLVALSLPASAQGWDWESLWSRADQRAHRALGEGNYDRAADLSRDPLRRGAAEYRRGRYQEALTAFGAGEGAVAAYIRGIALAQLGRYPEALAAYDEALALDPSLEDARHNRAQVQELLDRQPPEPPQREQSEEDPSGEEGQRGEGGEGDPPPESAAEGDSQAGSPAADGGSQSGTGTPPPTEAGPREAGPREASPREAGAAGAAGGGQAPPEGPQRGLGPQAMGRAPGCTGGPV